MVAEGGTALRVCTVSDGVESVLRIASYLSTLDKVVERTDLQLLHARDHLLTATGRFDLLVIAPGRDKGAAPLAAQAALEAGLAKSDRQVVLLDSPGARRLKGGPATETLRGEMFVPEAEPGRGRLLRLFRRSALPEVATPPAVPPPRRIAVHGMAGGAGASIFAATLGVEMARGGTLCLLDLDLQFGSVATYLDLPAEPKILNAYRDLRSLDPDAFAACLHRRGGLAVFSAPPEVLPLDALGPVRVQRLLDLAAQAADNVLVHLPLAATDWTETVYAGCNRIYALCLPDVRSAGNARRMRALMQASGLSDAKVHYVLNRVPARPTAAWRAERESFEKSLGRPFAALLPEGGEAVRKACNAGMPLAAADPKSPLLAAIRALARTDVEV